MVSKRSRSGGAKFPLVELVQDGFSLPVAEKPAGLAFSSLKIALQAYFSTYQAMRTQIHLFDPCQERDQEETDFNHRSAYATAYAETIVHFQHFVELICGDILRERHPLLALDTSGGTVLFDKLLKGEATEPSEWEALQTPGFAVVLARVCDLIKTGRLGDAGDLGIFVTQREFLLKLAQLRNRIWHQGTFVLRYPALDRFVGQYCLPFVKTIVGLDRYSDLNRFWKHEPLACGIDPIDVLETELVSGNYDPCKIAILKELGRASFSNPIVHAGLGGFPNRDHQRRAKLAAEAVAGLQVYACPVCGTHSLVAYEDVNLDDYDEDEGAYGTQVEYVWQVKCHCCTFSLDHQLGNPKGKHGLPLDNYWRYRINQGEWIEE